MNLSDCFDIEVEPSFFTCVDEHSWFSCLSQNELEAVQERDGNITFGIIMFSCMGA